MSSQRTSSVFINVQWGWDHVIAGKFMFAGTPTLFLSSSPRLWCVFGAHYPAAVRIPLHKYQTRRWSESLKDGELLFFGFRQCGFIVLLEASLSYLDSYFKVSAELTSNLAVHWELKSKVALKQGLKKNLLTKLYFHNHIWCRCPTLWGRQ